MQHLIRGTKYLFANSAELKRGNYKVIDPSDIEYFKTFLSESQVITDKTELEFFNQSWNHLEMGRSQVALTPKDTSQVSKILEYCNSKGIAVVPQGGNTGLVGGSVPVFDEIVLSTRSMHQIEKFNKTSSVITVQAGVVLEKANEFLYEHGC